MQGNKKGREHGLSEKLGQTMSALVRISFSALIFLHGVPMEVPLDGLKILNNLIIKNLFSLIPENTHTSPTHVHYTFLWNDSLLANGTEKGEGQCLKLIRKKEAFDLKKRHQSPGLEAAKIILQILESLA